MTTMESICECPFVDTESKNIMKQNALVQNQLNDIEEILNGINVYLLKCISLIKKSEKVVKCYGGVIILILIIIQIICTIFYCLKSVYYINIHL